MEGYIILPTRVSEKFTNFSVHQYVINPLFWVSLPGFTMQCGMKCTGKYLKTLQGKNLLLLLGTNSRGRIPTVMADRSVKWDKKKILYIDANNFYGWAVSQSLPYVENRFDKDVKMEENFITPDDSDIKSILEFVKNYPDIMKNKTKYFLFLYWKKIVLKIKL